MKKAAAIILLLSNTSYSQELPIFSQSTGIFKIPYLEVEKIGGYSATLKFSEGKFSIDSAIPTKSSNIGSAAINRVYQGVSNPPGSFATDSTSTMILIKARNIDITLDKFFTKECRLTGTITLDSSNASGTYQCADFTNGNWSSSRINLVEGILIAKFNFQPSQGATYSLKVVGL
jgi:hypothetical protein